MLLQMVMGYILVLFSFLGLFFLMEVCIVVCCTGIVAFAVHPVSIFYPKPIFRDFSLHRT